MKRLPLTSASYGVATLLLVFALLKAANPFPYGISIGPITLFAMTVYGVISGFTAVAVFLLSHYWPKAKTPSPERTYSALESTEHKTKAFIGVALKEAYNLGYADGQLTGSRMTVTELVNKLQGFKLAVIAAVAIAVSGCTINQGPSPAPSPVPLPSVTVTDVPADLQQQVDAALAVHPVETAWQYHGYYTVMAERFPTYQNCGQFGNIAAKVNSKFGTYRPLEQVVIARLSPLLNPPAKPTTDPNVPIIMRQIAEACKRHALAR
jgi:hypothetical protein